MSQELHLYIKNKPSLREAEVLLKDLGFRQVGFIESQDMMEPNCVEWQWFHLPLSSAGFKLLYFDGLFRDSIHIGEYQSFVAMEGFHDSSPIDIAMIDIAAAMILRRYDGIIHNPQRIDRKFPNVFLCGANNTKVAEKASLEGVVYE